MSFLGWAEPEAGAELRPPGYPRAIARDDDTYDLRTDRQPGFSPVGDDDDYDDQDERRARERSNRVPIDDQPLPDMPPVPPSIAPIKGHEFFGPPAPPASTPASETSVASPREIPERPVPPDTSWWPGNSVPQKREAAADFARAWLDAQALRPPGLGMPDRGPEPRHEVPPSRPAASVAPPPPPPPRPIAPSSSKPPLPPTIFQEAAHNFTRGALDDGLGSAGQGLTALLGNTLRYTPRPLGDLFAQGLAQVNPLTGIVASSLPYKKTRELEIQALDAARDGIGQGRAALREALPVSPEFAESVAGQITGGAGQALGSLPLYAVPWLGPAAAVGQIYDQAHADAVAHGASEEQAHQAALMNVPAAAIDTLADKFLIGKFLKAAKGKMSIGRWATHAIAGLAANGASQAVQRVWQNFIARTLSGYDPNRPIDEEVIRTFIVGLATGGFVTGAGKLLGGARRLLPGHTPEPAASSRSAGDPSAPGAEPALSDAGRGAPESASGTASFQSIPWVDNPDGTVRNLSEVHEIARQYGIEIPKDVQLHEAEEGSLGPGVFATYGKIMKRPGHKVRWADLYTTEGKIIVRLDKAVLRSDEGIVASLSHEIHELKRLREIFEAAPNGQVSFGFYRDQIDAERKGKLHLEALKVSNDYITKLREAKR